MDSQPQNAAPPLASSREQWHAWRWPVLLALSALLHFSIIGWIDRTLREFDPNLLLKDQPIEVAIMAPPPPAAEPARIEPVKPAVKPARPVRPRPPRAAASAKKAPVSERLTQSPSAPVEAAPATPAESNPPAAGPFVDPGLSAHGLAAQNSNETGPSAPDAPVTAAAPAPEAAVPPATEPAVAEAAKPALLYGTALPGLPASGSWGYKIYYGDYTDEREIAEVQYTLEHDGDRYSLRTEGRAVGLTAWVYSGALLQTSRGRVTENGMEPERYSEQRGKRPERGVAVDYGKREVSFSSDNRVALVDGLQDRLSSLMQLGLIARGQPDRFATGRQIDLPEITSNTIETAHYRSEGDAVLQTTQGALRSVHLVRIAPASGENPKVEMWLGYDHTMLPVRIRLTDANGRVLDQLLQRSGG
jgi:Protein of unknown function (DUF3108)